VKAERALTTSVDEYVNRIWRDRPMPRLVADRLTGACTYTYPVPVTPGRADFGPALTLQYDSSLRNGPFGWGWNLSLPYIGRRLTPHLPQYLDDVDDVCVIFDAEQSDPACGTELVPALRNGDAWVDDQFDVGDYLVRRYRRRFESGRQRIERWQHRPSGQVHWRVTDAGNVTSLYGVTTESREFDPDVPNHVLRWLLSDRFDDRGNAIRYVYSSDNRGAVRYIKRIQYANAAPFDRDEWHYQIVFDYGDHDDSLPAYEPSQQWDVRKDEFYDGRAGFERRWSRRCRRIMTFHSFQELAPEPVIVQSTDLEYDDAAGVSLLTGLQNTGYIVRSDGNVQKRSDPPVEFGYQRLEFDNTVSTLSSDVVVGALTDERSGARWIDLHGEALPGLAMRVGGSWCFVRNYGDGVFGEPEVAADTLRLEADGSSTAEPGQTGPSEVGPPAHESEYRPTTAMRTQAEFGGQDPHTEYLDLNGDGVADAVIADDQHLRWYPSQGQDGFGDAVVVKLDGDHRMSPKRLYADNQQSIWAADMNGDGLYDLVRIRSGEVSYWPRRNRERFGDRIVMESAPTVPNNDVGGDRLLLGDLTGTGTTDIIWIDDGEIRYWPNSSGHGFVAHQRVSAPGVVPGGPGVAVVDLFGRGANCIVWIDRTSGSPSLRYVSPVGDRLPYLLVRANNGRGGETRCSYVSVAEMRRRDRLAGRDQLTPLAVPAQVVERIEHRDYAANTRDITRYAYRHGAYDDQARRFIGFAYREEWRSGSQDDYTQPGLFAHEPAIGTESNKRAAATLLKTWTHTGLMFEGEDLAAELAMDYFADPETHRRSWLNTNDVPESENYPDVFVALRGRVIREELYDVSSGMPAVPLTVDESTHMVRQLQPSRHQVLGVHEALLREHVRVLYNVEGNDPRIVHDLLLRADSYGAPLLTAVVSYQRRTPEDSAQSVTHVQLYEHSYVNCGDQPAWYRIGVPHEAAEWVMSGLSPTKGPLFSVEDLQAQFDQPDAKRLVAKKRFQYWSNDLSRISSGTIESKALLARVDQLAMNDEMVAKVYAGQDVSDALRYEGGYVNEDGSWWALGNTVGYSARQFYLPSVLRDAVGRQSTVRYDRSGLSVAESEDGCGNTQRYSRHLRLSVPWLHIDANRNAVADRFDPLGRLLSRAIIGKLDGDQGDYLALDVAEASNRDDPTLVVTYGSFDVEKRTPSFVRIRRRQEHRGSKSHLVDTYLYYDSEGRPLCISARNDEGSWLITDYVVLNSQGAVVAKADPFLCETPWPNAERAGEALTTAGHFYTFDALGRLTREDQPGGTYVTHGISTWSVDIADANDNILDTAWYAERQGASQGRASDFAERIMRQYEARAAAVAAVHANTPSVQQLDARGLTVAVREVSSRDETIFHRFQYDSHGALVAIRDNSDLIVKRYTHDLMGRVIQVESPDIGKHRYLLASTGEVLRLLTPDGHCVRHRYDANCRRTHTYVDSGNGSETLEQRTIWGGGEVSIPEAEQRNLIGVAHMQLSSGGLRTIDACDWNGNELSGSIRTATLYQRSTDWKCVDAVASSHQLVETLTAGDNPLLSGRQLTFDASYDALGRVLSKSERSCGSLVFEFGAHEWLQRIRWRGHDRDLVLLDEVRYNSNGKPSVVRFGNGAWTRRLYNWAGRISHVSSAVRGQDAPLQDLSVAYDPNGNVTIVGEGSDLVAAYAYDGLDRMIRAEGRETADDTSTKRVPYVDSYDLDSEGNIRRYRRRSGTDEKIVEYEFRDSSNQLAGEYEYDRSGNLISTPENRMYRWNALSQLERVDLDDGTVIHLGYSATGDLMRQVIVSDGGRDIREWLVFDEFASVAALKGDGEQEQYVLARANDVSLARVSLISGDVAAVFALSDHVGSVTLTLDESGGVIDRRQYAAYGSPVSALHLNGPAFGYLGATSYPRLPLYQIDGFWFDPGLCRFLQPTQPTGLTQSAQRHGGAINPYLFRNANPQR
jgi:YD repeat-containing protein